MIIRADNWRFRYDIALSGRYPRKDWYGKLDLSNTNDALPAHGNYGAIAYLEVIAHDSVELSRNEWDTGDSTICAECAEKCRPDIESEWGYLPLHESNGDIGNYPGVTRCERCDEVIIDAETLAVVTVIGDETDTYTFDSLDLDKAEERFKEWYEIALESRQQYAIALLDAERSLESYRTGESWPITVLNSADTESDKKRNRYVAFARALEGGQQIMPEFPHMRYENPIFPQFLSPIPAWMEKARKGGPSHYAPDNPISTLNIPVPDFT